MINLIKVVQIKEITQTTQSLSPLFFSSCVLCIYSRYRADMIHQVKGSD